MVDLFEIHDASLVADGFDERTQTQVAGAALRHGHAEVVKLLFEAGADVTENEAEFVQIALKNGDAPSLIILGRHVKTPILPYSLNAVNVAINTLSLRTVEIVLSVSEKSTVASTSSACTVGILELLRGSGVNFAGQNHQILDAAISSADVGVIKFLLSEGVVVTPQSGFSMLNAISFGNAEVIELLLRAGAELKDVSHITFAHVFDSLEAVLLLHDYRYSWTACADELVAVAAFNKAPRILKYVLAKKRVAQATLDQGLADAIRCEVEDSVDTLIKHGASPTFSKSLALKNAIDHGSDVGINIARKLIAAGALVTDLDSTAISKLVEVEAWDFLRDLLRQGVRITPVDFTQNQAVKFVAEMKPQDFINDRDGLSFPLSVLNARYDSIKIIGAVAEQKSGDDKIKVVEWLQDFLGELTSNMLQMRAAMNG
jgi:hypothetical protein